FLSAVALFHAARVANVLVRNARWQQIPVGAHAVGIRRVVAHRAFLRRLLSRFMAAPLAKPRGLLHGFGGTLVGAPGICAAFLVLRPLGIGLPAVAPGRRLVLAIGRLVGPPASALARGAFLVELLAGGLPFGLGAVAPRIRRHGSPPHVVGRQALAQQKADHPR